MTRWALLVLAGCSSAAPPAVVSTPPPAAAPSPPPVAPDPAPPAFRLPGDVVPVSYGLELTIDPAATSFSGIVRIHANVVRSTSVVWLNARELGIGKAPGFRVIAGGEQFTGLVSAKPLPVGPIDLEISYVGSIDKKRSQGIYSETEGNEAYAYTFFEAIDARRAFPCFDEPNYKVPWQLTFHIKKDHIARGNAPIVKETDEGNGMKRVELAPTKPLPSYLVAFMVGPFEDIDDGVAGRVKTPIHFIIPKGRSSELAYAKQVTPKVVVALENYFDMDYPFGKLDVAVVPRFWGTMEHPGIVAMGQPLTLIRPDQQTHDREEFYANILAHEMAHYWFGDLVTLAWWNDTWLNESLGQWMDVIITNAVEPSWKFTEQRTARLIGSLPSDELRSARATRQDVKTNEEIQASFDGDLTYNKGSTVLHQIESFVGADKWQAFIRAYVRKHAWGNATEADFLGEMKAALGETAAGSFEQYITRPGAPLAHVHADCTAKQLVLDPMPRALPAGIVEDADDQRVFTVPICVRYGDGKRSEHACLVKSIAIDFCPTWVISNAESGWYRSVLDAAMVRAMLAPGSAAKPTRSEKLLMVADLGAMVNRAQLPIDRALELVPLLVKDPDPKIAQQALLAAPFPGYGLDDELYARVHRWYVSLYSPLAKQLTWHHAKGDSIERRELRVMAMNTVAREDETVRAQAQKLVDQWLKDRTGLDDDLVNTALAAVARLGDAGLFDRIVDAAKHARDHDETKRLLTVLGSFTDPALAVRARDLVYGKEFDLRDKLDLLTYVQLYRRETRDAALESIEQHLDEILPRMRDDEASWAMGAIASAFCDAPHRARVAKLLTSRAEKIAGAKATVERGLEVTDQCIAEVARETPALQRFFKK